MANRIGHFINGQRAVGASGRTQPVYDPATGSQSGSVDLAGLGEVRTAVRAAMAAFPQWA